MREKKTLKRTTKASHTPQSDVDHGDQVAGLEAEPFGDGDEMDIDEQELVDLSSSITNIQGVDGNVHGKGDMGGKGYVTPTKQRAKRPSGFSSVISDTESTVTPVILRHVDRSARKKTNQALLERTVAGDIDDTEDGDDVFNQLYDTEEEEDDTAVSGQGGSDGEALRSPQATPSKRPGRRKASQTRKRSLSPPAGTLPPHELYFSQNRTGRTKTGNSNLTSLKLLDHEEYFKLLREYEDPHTDDLVYLQELYAESFVQWQFELSQSFNLCLYGFGSKRSLLMKFAEHIYNTFTDPANEKIVVVNGYVQGLTIKDVLNTVCAAITEPGTARLKLGSQPAEMLENLIALLEADQTKRISLVVHSVDGQAFRRPAAQNMLSRLASTPQIHFIASADHPSFPLLWDSSLRSSFNFLFHDCTTFQPYKSEMDVVDEVNELLGRSGRRVGGKGGVSFVLKSLPDNGRKLYKILILEQLAAMDNATTGHTILDDDDGGDDDNNNTSGMLTRTEPGVEYRILYKKATEDFICSNEMNFRTLLKEFHDHQMLNSKSDSLGTEILSVPFRREEMDNILEDLDS